MARDDKSCSNGPSSDKQGKKQKPQQQQRQNQSQSNCNEKDICNKNQPQ